MVLLHCCRSATSFHSLKTFSKTLTFRLTPFYPRSLLPLVVRPLSVSAVQTAGAAATSATDDSKVVKPQWKASIDFKWIRDNKEAVTDNIANRKSSANLELVLELYDKLLNVQKGVICCKFGSKLNNEDRCFRRRDVLHSIGAAVGMDLIARSSLFVEEANAADLIQRRHDQSFSIKGILYEAMKGNPDIVPSILTLALNDIMTYDKATKSGGPNGSIRFSSEISRPENKGLAAALSLLEDSKKEIDADSKGGPISYADLIQLAAQSAVKSTFLASAIRKCGGNVEKGSLLYSAYGSNGQWGLFDRQFGRSDAQEPDPEGRVPQWDKASVQEMKDKFKAVGFGPRELAVMSAFIGPDQDATEALLANDPEVLPWVQKYQRSRETVSRTDYEVDLITTLTKLSCLGQQINYEAYSYPVQKIDVTKLKL